MVARVTEERRPDAPLFVHPHWHQEYDWLVHGFTAREAGDFASFGDRPAAALHAQWRTLRDLTATRAVVIGRQVHGAHVLEHQRIPDGSLFTDDADGHVTSATGVLLAVTTADCVPILAIDVERRRVAALHAGWRGVAAGIAGRGIALTGGSARVHLGPAICGRCYEVGPDVHVALGLPAPPRPAPVDLRAVLARQLVAAGIPTERISASTWCTRCGDSPFFSHRAGHAQRQAGIIGTL